MYKIINYIIFGLLLYFIFQHRLPGTFRLNHILNSSSKIETPQQNDPKNLTNKDSSPHGTLFEKTISNIVNNIASTPQGQTLLSRLIQPIDQAIVSSNYSVHMQNNFIDSILQIKTSGPELTGPAICGNIVTIEYQIYDSKFSLQEAKSITYTLGNGDFSPEFDSIVCGMHEEQVREGKILHIKKLETLKEANNYFVKITLKKIFTDQFISKESVKIFDDEMAYKTPLFCGNLTSFDAKIIRGSNGEVIFNTKNSNKISYKIGDLSYPMIFSYALHGKVPVGNRTILAQRKDFSSLIKPFILNIPITSSNMDEYLIIEITNLSNVSDPIK